MGGFQLGKTSDRNQEGNPQLRFDSCRGCIVRNCRIYIVNDFTDIYSSNYTGIYLDHVHDTVVSNNLITGGTDMLEDEGRPPALQS